MAHFYKTASGEIQQMVMIPAEEAAAFGVNIVQQQPPPSQHVVQFTTYQPHVNQSSVYHIADSTNSQEFTPASEEADAKVEVSNSSQAVVVQHQPIQQIHAVKQVLTAAQQSQLKAVSQTEQVQKFHVIHAMQSVQSQPQPKPAQPQLINQTVQSQATHLVPQTGARQLVVQQQIQQQLEPKATQQQIKLKPILQVKRLPATAPQLKQTTQPQLLKSSAERQQVIVQKQLQSLAIQQHLQLQAAPHVQQQPTSPRTLQKVQPRPNQASPHSNLQNVPQQVLQHSGQPRLVSQHEQAIQQQQQGVQSQAVVQQTPVVQQQQAIQTQQVAQQQQQAIQEQLAAHQHQAMQQQQAAQQHQGTTQQPQHATQQQCVIQQQALQQQAIQQLLAIQQQQVIQQQHEQAAQQQLQLQIGLQQSQEISQSEHQQFTQEAAQPQVAQPGIVRLQSPPHHYQPQSKVSQSQQIPLQTILKLPPSQLQQLQQHLATQGQQMILVQPTQQQHVIQHSPPTQRNTVPTQPHILHHVIQPPKNQQQRFIRPLLIQKNQRFVTPVIIRKPVPNNQDSHQTVMMMYPPRQVSVENVTQTPAEHSPQRIVQPQNGAAHSSEIPSNKGIGNQLGQDPKSTINTNESVITKSSPGPAKPKNCKKKSGISVQHIAVTRHVPHSILASQRESQVQLKVPNQPHGLQLRTSSNQMFSVSNVTTQTQTVEDQVNSQPVAQVQSKAVLTNNEGQLENVIDKSQLPSGHERQQEASSSNVQLTLSAQQLQKLLQQRQLHLQPLTQVPQQLANLIKTEASSPPKAMPSSGVTEVQNCSSVQLINCRNPSELSAIQNALKSKAPPSSADHKLEPGANDLQQQHVLHVQTNKVNYILDADVFFKTLMDDDNLRIVVRPDGSAALQRVDPTSVQHIPQESHVAVFDGMEVKDEFPTGVLQECVVSESGEVIPAHSNSVRTEAEPSDDSKTVDFPTLVVPKQEPGEEQLSGEGTQVTSFLEGEHKIVSPAPYPPDGHHVPKFVTGMLAVCTYCGYVSRDFSRCERCLRKMSENVKAISDGCLTLHCRKNALSNMRSTICPRTTVASVLVKRTLNLPAEFKLEKIAGRPHSKPDTSLHGTVVISPDVKRKCRHSNKRVRTKVPEEPEILTLSSDDEDKKEEKSVGDNSLLISNIRSVQDAEAKAIASSEEPDSSDETVQRSEGVEGGGMMEQAVDGSIGHPHVMIQCRTVRIGTYKEKPSERVTISPSGVEIKLSSSKQTNTSDLRVYLKMSDIKKVLSTFNRSMPVLFIYMRPEGAAKVRELLNMTDPKGSSYFDPSSYEETQRRITLLPEKLSEEAKKSLNDIFKNIMTEINYKLANEILVKSSPRENLRPKPSAPGGEIKTIMVYPPPPAKGGISINTEDYACLGEDQFLNDVIIDFYLKYLMQSVLSEEDRERTHVFSSFFYKRLTSRPKTKGRKHPIEDDPKLSGAQKRHARVKGWTKNVNLFSKDFIIIPINESCHWFLAIICFPGQDGCRRMSDNSPIDPPVPTSSAVVAAAAAAVATTNAKLKVQNNVMSIGSTTITPVKAPGPATITLDHNGDEGSDRDEAEGDEEEMEETTSDDEQQERTHPKADTDKTEKECSEESSISSQIINSCAKVKKLKERESIKQPCILIFDSLVGAPRYRVVATLRDYLSIEYKAKEGKDKEFSKHTIKGMLPKVPQQNNFTDCGLYVLQYVESFFKNPIKDYHHPIKELQDWFPEEKATRKREEIVKLLHDLMLEQNINPTSLPLPVLTFSHNTTSEQGTEESGSVSQEEETGTAEELAASILAKQQAEDTEAAARLVASMEPHQQAEPEDEDMSGSVSHAAAKEETCVEESMESSLVTADESLPHTQLHQVSVVSAVSKGKVSVGSCERFINKVDEKSDIPSAGHSVCSLVDYPESSDDSSSDQATVKRGGDQEESIDRKKRKCVES